MLQEIAVLLSNGGLTLLELVVVVQEIRFSLHCIQMRWIKSIVTFAQIAISHLVLTLLAKLRQELLVLKSRRFLYPLLEAILFNCAASGRLIYQASVELLLRQSHHVKRSARRTPIINMCRRRI